MKARKIFAAWSQQGNVLIKKEEGSKITQINDHSDLMNVSLGVTNHDADEKKWTA